eukprot:3524169-Pyramimonas_sp.AAC.1
MGSSVLGTACAAAALAAPAGGEAWRSAGTTSCGSNSSRSLDSASAWSPKPRSPHLATSAA